MSLCSPLSRHYFLCKKKAESGCPGSRLPDVWGTTFSSQMERPTVLAFMLTSFFVLPYSERASLLYFKIKLWVVYSDETVNTEVKFLKGKKKNPIMCIKSVMLSCPSSECNKHEMPPPSDPQPSSPPAAWDTDSCLLKRRSDVWQKVEGLLRGHVVEWKRTLSEKSEIWASAPNHTLDVSSRTS